MQFYNDFSERGRKYFRRGMGLFLAGLVFASFAMGFSYWADAKKTMHPSSGPTQLSVTGEGKVAAKPDIALLSATVATERSTVSAAQTENTVASDRVMRFLRDTGVEERDVKTTNYSIYPQYYYPENRRPEITGYQVRNSFEIKVRDLAKIDDILGGIVTAGANEVGNVSFIIEDPDKLKAEARKLAIAMAKEKAKTLAGDLRVRLKRIAGFAESDGSFPPPVPYYMKETALGRGGGGDFGPELSGGEQEIRVSVTITYDFSSR